MSKSIIKKILLIVFIILIGTIPIYALYNTGDKKVISDAQFYKWSSDGGDNNIYCIEKYRTFNPGTTYTAEDKNIINENETDINQRKLAFILGYRNNKENSIYSNILDNFNDKINTNHEGKTTSTSAYAIWKYWDEVKGKDQTALGLSIDEDMSYYACRRSLWKVSDLYANFESGIENATVSVDKDGKINISKINTSITIPAEYSTTGEAEKITLAGIQEVKVGETKKYVHTDGYYYTGGSTGDVKVTFFEYKIKAEWQNLELANPKYYSQKLIYGSGEIVKSTRTVVCNLPDVSIQKYISAVNDKKLSANNTELTSRENQMAGVDESWEDASGNVYKHTKAIAASEKASEDDVNKTKKATAVRISQGDEVTYTIKVYNNSSVDIKNVIIEDECIQGTIIEKKGSDKEEIGQEKIIKIDRLKAEETIVFYITVKYKNAFNGIAENKAYVYLENNINWTNYRTYDCDFVKMGTAISLEKFVSQVNGNAVEDQKYDVNCDGFVDMRDPRYLLEKLAKGGLTLDESINLIENFAKYDVNEDNWVNEADAIEVATFINKTAFTNIEKYDVNGDGRISVSDQRHIVNYYTKYGASDKFKCYKNINKEKNNKYDFDGNDMVNIDDASILEGYIGKTGLESLKYDVDGDNDVDTDDCAKIEEYYTEYEDDSDFTCVYINKYDVNEDNWVNEADAIEVEDFIKNTTSTNIEEKYDVNGDGKVDDKDKLIIEAFLRDYKGSVGASYVSYIDTAKKDSEAEDLNGDGKFSVSDVRKAVVYISRNTREFKRYNENSYKKSNPVKVKNGDIITYTIKITNTGGTDIDEVEIQDTYNGMLTYDSIACENGAASITEEGIIRVVFDEQLKPGEDFYLAIKFKVNLGTENVTSQVLENKAEIISINKKTISDDGDGTANNSDIDWVETPSYSMSLEKFVSQVNGNTVENSDYDSNGDKFVDFRDARHLLEELANGKEEDKYDINKDGNFSIADVRKAVVDLSSNIREFKRYNENSYKETNPVSVESGDTITYTIKLSNTGEGEIKKVKFQDTYNGMLTYDSIACVNGTGTYESGSITVTFAQPLKPGEDFYLAIKFKVNVPADKINTEHILSNKAEIIEICDSTKENTDFKVTDEDGTYNNCDKDWVKTKSEEYNVSLEKFVSKVNNTAITGRNGKAEYLTQQNNQYIDKTTSDTKWTQHNTYKKNNPEVVYLGKNVTYTIRVKNESTTKVKVNIKDTLPAIISKYIFGTGTPNIDRPENGIITKNIEIASGEVEDICITVLLKETDDIGLGKYVNTAEITEIKNSNDKVVIDITPNNNKDSDYIKLKTAVKLEKYVTKVTNSGGNITSYTSNGKSNSPVQVEPGDLVTFRINLTNTGEASIKITELTDEFTKDKLIYQNVTGATNGTASFNEGKITFAAAKVLAKGASVYVDIQFKVDIPYSETNISKELSNKATITTVKYSGEDTTIDLNTQDGDGIGNNTDEAGLKTKTYAVSLEKFVSKVNSIAITGRNGKAEYLTQHNTYKKNNPEVVYLGKNVTYTIRVKNESTTKVNVNIKDTLPAIISKYIIGTGTPNIDRPENGIITTTIEIASGEEKNIDITVLLKEADDIGLSKYVNAAEITKIENSNNKEVIDTTPNNNKDSDYIKLKTAVKLEKYVTKVTNSGGNITSYTSNGKSNSPVQVEPGDLVTFRINLTNTGEASIKITELTDEFTKDKLIYQNVTGSTNGTASFNEGKITFAAAKVLAKGASVYVDIQFKVDIPYSETNISKELSNKATITTVKYSGEDTTIDINTQDGDGIGNNTDTAGLKTKTYAVSLEKFVSKVNSIAITGRNGKAEYLTQHNTYKKNNPEVVYLGKNVTYTIRVKNESTTKVKVNIKDTLPAIISKYTFGTGNPNSDRPENGIITKNIEIASGEVKDIDITVLLKEADDIGLSKYVNAAEITKIENSNNKEVIDTTPNNNKDSDYIKLKTAVKLEKYVTKVTNSGGNITSYTSNGKSNSPVQVEPGDLVTFRINLTNTGEASIKITELTDEFTKDKLIYQKVTGATNGTASFNEGKITFVAAKVLAKGASVYVDIQFKVDIPYSETNISKELSNKATITTVKYSGEDTLIDLETQDSDGIDNNTDTAGLKTKTYAVSLEKYVTNVTDINGNNEVSYANRAGYRYNSDAITKVSSNSNADKITYSSWKKENPVELEAGDKVTFTIKLTNSGTTPVEVAQIYDQFTYNEAGNLNGLKLVYDETYGIKGYGDSNKIVNANYAEDANNAKKDLNKYLIKFEKATLIQPSETMYLTVRFKVEVAVNLTTASQTLYNKVGIVTLKNRNEIEVKDSDGEDNNHDQDFLKTKTYALSLEKFVSKVGDTETTERKNIQIYNYDNKYKENYPVIVANGNKVTYAIKITNNGTTNVKNVKIKDTLPRSGLNLDTVKIEKIVNTNGNQINNAYSHYSKVNNVVTLTLTSALKQNESNTIYLSATVTESNMSLNILKNYAEIIEPMQNRNGKDVKDTTPNNNQDADYIQMRDIVISGTVWNDKALEKKQDNYNGRYDRGSENLLSGIVVELYRGNNLVATTTTGDDGQYTFSSSSQWQVKYSHEKYIKAAKNKDNERWNDDKTYYSYYIKFKYDGITYTSTVFTNVSSTNELDSNAKETEGERINFNNKFSIINKYRSI